MNVSLVNQNQIQSIQYNNKFLHSLRNPQREADRIVESQLIESSIQRRISKDRSPQFILLNPGLGYAVISLRRIYPLSNIFAVYTDTELYSVVCKSSPQFLRNIHCTLLCNYSDFSYYLDTLTLGLNILTIQLIEWKASQEVKGHLDMINAFYTIIELKHTEIMTQLYFGKVWIRNIIKNTQLPISMRHVKKLTGPVFLCASGNSLSRAIPIIQKFKSKVHVWALSSSVQCLLNYNIVPQYIISTDGGYWAELHLRKLPCSSHILLSLHSRISQSQLQSIESLEFFSTDLPILQKVDSIRSLNESGSVLFSALNFLEKVSTGPVILFGADFSTSLYQSHARPHAFDKYIESQGCRTFPLSTNRFFRSIGSQLRHYAYWLNLYSNNLQIFRWRDSGVHLSIPDLRSESDIEKVIDLSPAIEAKWELRKHTFKTEDIFKHTSMYQSIPNNLFSDPDNRSIIETLLFVDGLKLKNYFTQWLLGENEAHCIKEFKKEFTPLRI